MSLSTQASFFRTNASPYVHVYTHELCTCACVYVSVSVCVCVCWCCIHCTWSDRCIVLSYSGEVWEGRTFRWTLRVADLLQKSDIINPASSGTTRRWPPFARAGDFVTFTRYNRCGEREASVCAYTFTHIHNTFSDMTQANRPKGHIIIVFYVCVCACIIIRVL